VEAFPSGLPLGPNSIIAWPSAGQTIPAPGLWEIRGIAWGGDGILDRVEVSTDGGETWHLARLDLPVQPRTFTRFRFSWAWDGRETVIMSKAVDGSGQVQPTRSGMLSQEDPPVISYPNNTRFRWRVHADGSVTGDQAQV
jgi:sulfane dehydrogenase subunit SoxC